MQIEKNELGQTLIYLTQEEWSDYGKQAGFCGDNIKLASTQQKTSSDAFVKIASLQKDINGLQNEITKKQAEILDIVKGEDVEQKVSPEKHAFDEKNYPNIFAEQNQEGLIGVFKK